MEYTYDYTIIGLDVHPVYDVYQNVVSRVVYEITGTANGMKYSYQAADLLDYETLSNFTPYENVTKEMIIEWLEANNLAKIQEIKRIIRWELNKWIHSQTIYFERPFVN